MTPSLKAFTLFELLIAMAISAVVISLVFFTFNNLQLQFSLYQKRATLLADAQRGLTLLERDFTLASRVVSTTENSFSCQLSDTLTLQYYFAPDYLLRTISTSPTNSSGIEPIPADTFPLKTVLLTPTFHQQSSDSYHSAPLISQLAWSFRLAENDRTLLLRKQYATFDFLSALDHGH